MPPAKSALAYADIQETLDRAVAAEKGVKVDRGSPGLATNFRHRAFAWIKKQRALTYDLYPQEDDPRRGTTPYDGLVFRIEGSVFFAEKRTARLEVEEL